MYGMFQRRSLGRQDSQNVTGMLDAMLNDFFGIGSFGLPVTVLVQVLMDGPLEALASRLYVRS
jgi:hypothetical protein